MSAELVGVIISGVRGNRDVARNMVPLRKHPDVAKLRAFNPEWQEGAQDFRPIVDRFLDTVGTIREQGNGSPIVIFEISAGAAIGEIAAQERPEWFSANVPICARLSMGHTTTPTQSEVLTTFPAHANAVTYFEQVIEPQMSDEQRERRLTMIPEDDEVVPVQSMRLRGATLFEMPDVRTHLESISAAFTTHEQVIVDFARRYS